MYLDKKSVVRSLDDLVKYYCKTENEGNLYVGIEWERSGIYRDTLAPVGYEGDRGYLAILKKLVSEAGWNITQGSRNDIYELKRGHAYVTLEADGRMELAGSPRTNLHDLAREFRIHANEVQEMSNLFNIGWLPIGWQPFHSNEEIKFINKKRYKVFLDLIDHSEIEDTMKKNNGLTVNLSYLDEKNLLNKVKTLFRISPVIGAIFASSPFEEGKVSKYLDRRRNCISKYGPIRNSVPKNILDENFSIKDLIDHYIKLPVILIKRRGKPDLAVKNLTFEQWMTEGYKNTFPTVHDFDQHIKTTWSDIRLRPSYIEYRVADSVPFRMAMAVPALVKGLIFDSESWKKIEELTATWTYDDIIRLDKAAWETGLKTEINGKDLLWYAKALVHIANDALHKFGRKDAVGGNEEDETVFLAPVKEQVYIKEKGVAQEMLDLWQKEWNQDPKRLLEWCEDGGPGSR